MKKCLKCEIVFKDEDRKKCLYCNALLASGSEDELANLREGKNVENNVLVGKSVVETILQGHKSGALDRDQYLLGSYFRTRTLTFMYMFCRNEFKIGKKYKRLLIQPVNMSSLLTLPWVIVNLLDSLFFRILYNGFCERCGWKYKKGYSMHEHKKDGCEYNKEYQSIFSDIMTGQIVNREKEYKQEAIEKVFAGKKSAYYNLCTSKHFMSGIIDVTCIWFSMILILVGIICASYPIIYLLDNVNTNLDDLYLR
jgi:hypothetical protein